MENAVVAVEIFFCVLDVKSGTVLIISSGRVLVAPAGISPRRRNPEEAL